MLMTIWGWWWTVEGMAAYSHSKIKPFSGKAGPSPSVMVATKQVFKGQTIIFFSFQVLIIAITGCPWSAAPT